MFATIARAVARRPWTFLGLWAVGALALMAVAPSLEEVSTQDSAEFLSEDAPSVRAVEAARRLWPEDELADTGALVFRREAGLTDADERYIRGVEEWLRSRRAPDVVESASSPWSRPELRDRLLSPDGKVAIVVVSFETPPFQPETTEAVQAIRARVADAPEGLRAHLTGNAGVAADESSAVEESVHRTTLITLVLISLILVWVFRSPVAPAVPLATIGAALLVSRAVVALLGSAGFEVSALVETFMVVIVFGAGTDYSLFIVARYREEIEGAGAVDRRRVLAGTIAVVGGVVASSAATVMVGFASQGAAEFGLFRSTGPALAIAVAVTLVAGLTLTPALLAVLGRRAFWPWRGPSERHLRPVREKAAA